MGRTESGESASKPLVELEPGLAALVFDFDGVLVDSDPMHWTAYRRAFERYGIEFGFDEYVRSAKGLGRRAVVDKFAAALDAEARTNIEQIKAVETRKLVDEDALVVVPGVTEFLTSARARGLKCAVASTSVIAPLAIERLGLRDHFDAVCATRAGERSKPYPDIFHRAFAQVDERSDECLVIEDTPVGVQAALAAGTSVVVRGNAEAWSEQELEARVLAFFASFHELHELLGWGALEADGATGAAGEAEA